MFVYLLLLYCLLFNSGENIGGDLVMDGNVVFGFGIAKKKHANANRHAILIIANSVD